MTLNLNVDFMDMAACRGKDPALFYPARYESTTEARAVCASCSVRIDCLEYALSLPIRPRHLGRAKQDAATTPQEVRMKR